MVRYLHADGADVEKDEPYVELEAMKMIMSLRSTEAGKIQHALSAGSIVSIALYSNPRGGIKDTNE